MSWNRPQCINPECHFMSPTKGDTASEFPFREWSKGKWVLQPRGHLIISIITFRGGNNSQSGCRQEESPKTLIPSVAAPKVLGLHQFFSAPCFFQFCVHYGKLLDGVVHGWTVFLARDNGTGGSQGCFLSLLSEQLTLAGPGRSGHLGPRLAPNTSLTVPYSPG